MNQGPRAIMNEGEENGEGYDKALK